MYEKDIYARPKRTWFQSQKAKEDLKNRSRGGDEGDTEIDGGKKKRTRVDRKKEKLDKSRERIRTEEKREVDRERKLSQMLAKRARKQSKKKQIQADNSVASTYTHKRTTKPKHKKRKLN